MKKFVALLLILSLMISLVGCGGSSAPAASPTPAAPAAPSAPAESSKPTEAPSAAAQPESNKAASEPAADPQADAADLGGYGGPGEDYVEEVIPYNLSFTDEETIIPYEIRTITTVEGLSGDFAVYTISPKTEIAAEYYSDNVLMSLVRLHAQPDGLYSTEAIGCLNGNNSWTAAPYLSKAGDRFLFTLDEVGLWEIMAIDGNKNFSFFFFEVKA